MFLANMRPFVIAENWFWWVFGPLYLWRPNMSHGFFCIFLQQTSLGINKKRYSCAWFNFFFNLGLKMKKSKKLKSSKSHPNFGDLYHQNKKGYFSFVFGYFFYILIFTKSLIMSKFEGGHFPGLPEFYI